MFAHALLMLFYEDGYIGIPVKNFPQLPVGSRLQIQSGKDKSVCLENARILGYSFDSRHGVLIEIKEMPYGAGDSEVENEKCCRAIAKACIRDPSLFVELVYPQEIDCGVRFTVSSAKKKRRK